MAEIQVTRIRSLKTRAMPKKKANWERVVSNSSDSCVVKTDAATLTTDEEKSDEPTLWVVEGEPSEV